MNFEQIKSFLSIEKAGNFSAAAKERYLSQPAISKQLKMLETELGVQLISRNSKSITLTEQGRKFSQYASKLIDIEKDIMIEINQGDEREYEVISIAMPYLQTESQLGDFFRRVLNEKQKVTYRIDKRYAEEIPNLVLSGKIDLGVTNVVTNNSKLKYEELFVEEKILITPNMKKYQELNREKIENLLLNEEYIQYICENEFFKDDFYEITGVKHKKIKKIVQCSNYNVVLDLVKSGCGVAFVSNTAMQTNRWNCEEILSYNCDGFPKRKVYIVYLKDRMEMSDSLKHTKNILVEEMNKDIWKTNIYKNI